MSISLPLIEHPLPTPREYRMVIEEGGWGAGCVFTCIMKGKFHKNLET